MVLGVSQSLLDTTGTIWRWLMWYLQSRERLQAGFKWIYKVESGSTLLFAGLGEMGLGCCVGSGTESVAGCIPSACGVSTAVCAGMAVGLRGVAGCIPSACGVSTAVCAVMAETSCAVSGVGVGTPCVCSVSTAVGLYKVESGSA